MNEELIARAKRYINTTSRRDPAARKATQLVEELLKELEKAPVPMECIKCGKMIAVFPPGG